jgi:hypothetical protein
MTSWSWPRRSAESIAAGCQRSGFRFISERRANRAAQHAVRDSSAEHSRKELPMMHNADHRRDLRQARLLDSDVHDQRQHLPLRRLHQRRDHVPLRRSRGVLLCCEAGERAGGAAAEDPRRGRSCAGVPGVPERDPEGGEAMCFLHRRGGHGDRVVSLFRTRGGHLGHPQGRTPDQLPRPDLLGGVPTLVIYPAALQS